MTDKTEDQSTHHIFTPGGRSQLFETILVVLLADGKHDVESGSELAGPLLDAVEGKIWEMAVRSRMKGAKFQPSEANPPEDPEPEAA